MTSTPPNTLTNTSGIPANIARWCAFLPIVTVHLCWLISSTLGNIEWCNPYWSQCVSISATGRQYPEFFLFKAGMIPAACLLLLYWWLLARWLSLQQVTAGRIRLIQSLGSVAAIALIVYTVMLGAVGEPYAVARRTGVVLYFALSAFAHLLTLQSCQQVAKNIPATVKPLQRLLYLCAVLVGLGVVSAILGFSWEGYNRWDNAIEWCFGLLMMGQFWQVSRLFAATHFQLTTQVSE